MTKPIALPSYTTEKTCRKPYTPIYSLKQIIFLLFTTFCLFVITLWLRVGENFLLLEETFPLERPFLPLTQSADIHGSTRPSSSTPGKSSIGSLSQLSDELLKYQPSPNKLMTYLPHSGATYQFLEIVRALTLAAALNRTLVIPPLRPSANEENGQKAEPSSWNRFFDLKAFTEKTGIPLIEWDDVYDDLVPEKEMTCVGLTGRHTKASSLHADKFYKERYNMTLHFEERGLADNPSALAKALNDIDDDLICLSDTFYLRWRLKEQWEFIGKYFRYSKELSIFADNITYDMFGVTPYIGIHLRRGDFKRICKKIINPISRENCWPTLETLQNTVSRIRQLSGMELPVFVATNSQNAAELRAINELGWKMVNYNLYNVEEKFGVFGRSMVEGSILTKASYSIGTRGSTFSKVAEMRMKDWYGGLGMKLVVNTDSPGDLLPENSSS